MKEPQMRELKIVRVSAPPDTDRVYSALHCTELVDFRSVFNWTDHMPRWFVDALNSMCMRLGKTMAGEPYLSYQRGNTRAFRLYPNDYLIGNPDGTVRGLKE